MPQGQQDYYAVLGILRDASAEEVKRAYHAAARRLHPDRNMLAGETELFLDVQQAYEVLSNPERRLLYDATLPPETTRAAPLECSVQYSRGQLWQMDEPQLLYALFTAAAPQARGSIPITPLNVCLVLDRSTSMLGPKMDVAKSAAIQILRMLRPEDVFSLVVFSDRAEVVLASGYQSDTNRAISRVQAIRPTGATELLHGLQSGLAEARRGLDPNRSNHLILLTDGHTYGDEQACLELGEEAGRLGIGISAFGVGTDWNDIFLDALASRTGGNSTYISDPREIQHILIEKLNVLAQIVVDDVVLEAAPSDGIHLQYAFRLQPEGGPVQLGETLHLGPIIQDVALHVLFEFVVDPPVAEADVITLLHGRITAQIAARPTPLAPIPFQIERPVGQTATGDAPPQAILNALSRLTLYRLQERARQEADSGDFAAATRHLRNLAAQLQAQGHHQLSRTTLLEAESLEKLHSLSPAGGKDLKYGTRALLLPAAGNS